MCQYRLNLNKPIQHFVYNKEGTFNVLSCSMMSLTFANSNNIKRNKTTIRNI